MSAKSQYLRRIGRRVPSGNGYADDDRVEPPGTGVLFGDGQTFGGRL